MKVRDVDLNLLLAFDMLMRERHITRAADKLEVSQSSMSGSFAKLKELFSDDILIRSGNTHVPTERALQLWPRIRDAIDAMELALLSTERFDPSTATHTFRLIVIDYIDALLMPSVMRAIRAAAPQVRIEVLQPNPHHFGELMSLGQLDLALTYFPDPPDFLKTRLLFNDRFVGVRAQGSGATGGLMGPAAFAELSHITIEPDFAQIYNVQINAALDALGLRRRVTMIKPSFLALHYTVADTDLVACVPQRLAERMVAQTGVETFELPLAIMPFEVRMLWHQRTQNSPAHEWLRALIVRCAGECFGAS